MRQSSFSELEYRGKRKQTRRDVFLAQIEALTPWSALESVIEPYYPKSGRRGRPPVGLNRMLRMYIAQQCFGLSDEGTEDAIYDSQSIRGFVGIDLSYESAPDATTLLKFRRLLETHKLTQGIFDAINAHLEAQNLLLREGTMVDATIIAAPPSTKNRNKARDPDMHQTRKGKQWYFGMKAHIGADIDSGVIHSLSTTAANVADITQADKLLHGQEQRVYGDAGYTGIDKRPEHADRNTDWQIAMKRSKRKALAGTPAGPQLEAREVAKAQIRAFVEHPFHILKNRFKHRKTRYRGLPKNTAQLYTLLGMANLFITKNQLCAAA